MSNRAEGEIMKLLLKGLIASLPEEERREVYAVSEQMRALVKKHGKAGVLAVMEVCAEEGTK